MPTVGSTQETISSATIISKNDIWVVGRLNVATQSAYIAHFNGTKWTASTLATTLVSLTSVSATGPDDVWAVGNGSPSELLHFNGKSWKTFPTPAKISEFGLYTGVVNPPGGGVWVTGDVSAVNNSVSGGAMHWDGHSWTVYNLTPKASVWAAAFDDHGGLWAVTEDGFSVAPRFWHFTSGRWFSSSASGATASDDYVYQLSAVPKARSMWAAGYVIASGRQAGAILAQGAAP